MDYAELRNAILEYFKGELQSAKARQNNIGPLSDETRSNSAATLNLLEQGNATYWKTMGSKHAKQELDKFFQASGLLPSNYSKHTKFVLDELRLARIRAIKELLRHYSTVDYYDFSEPKSVPEMGQTAITPQTTGTSLAAAVEAFFSEHERTAGWTAGTIQKRRAGLDIAIEWFGKEADIGQIGKMEAASLKEAIISLPANRLKSASTRDLPLREAIKVEGVSKIGNATINSYLSTYKVFWAWA